MNNTTYNPYVNNQFREQGLLDLAKAQMLWLRENTDYTYETIGSIVGYAKSTVSNYIRKFADDVRYLLDSFVGKIVARREKKKKVENTACTSGEVIYKCEEVADGTPTAYLAEIFDGNDFSFIKIGFSSHIRTRIKAHARNRKYGSDNKVVVYKCFTFEDDDQALSMENCLRKFFKERNDGEDYLKRDRFTEQRVDEEILTTLQEKANFILNNF